MTMIMLDKSPEQIAEEFLQNMPAKFLGCHGFGHAFPKVGSKQGRRLISRTVNADGSREISMKCPDCGTIRYRTRNPNAISYFDDTMYRYDWPDGYLAPAGTYEFLPRRVYQDEAMRRYEEELDRPTGGEEMPRFQQAG